MSHHCYNRLHYKGSHSTKTDTRPHPSKGQNITSLLQQDAVPSGSLQLHRYKGLPYQMKYSHRAATTDYSTMGLIATTPIHEPTLPRDIFSPQSNNRLQYQGTHFNQTDKKPTLPSDIASLHLCNVLHYQVTHSNQTDTRAHPNNGNRLTLLLQQCAV
jgi:hypothetical protein